MDCWGTLLILTVDKEEYAERGLRGLYAFLREKGLRESYSEFVKINQKVFSRASSLIRPRNLELNLTEVYSELLRELRLSKVSPADAIQSYWNALRGLYKIAEGVKEELFSLKQEGFKLGVVSNHVYPPYVREALRGENLLNLIDVTIISGELGVRKPSSKIFQEALKRLRLNPRETVFIGDSLETDIEGALKVGMRAIYLGSEETSADIYRAPNLREALRLARSLLQ